MMANRPVCLAVALALTCCATAYADETVLFEDTFDHGLSKKWQVVGLAETDYRIRDGALEMKVSSGKYVGHSTPMLKVILPFTAADSVVASVELVVKDKFTAPEERAGLLLIDEKSGEFSATKQLLNRQLFFSPPRVRFVGKPGQESDLSKYSYTYRPAADDAGPLRIIVRSNSAYFQVGPSKEGKYLNFFYSAIRRNTQERGFALFADGAPPGKSHWVRFDNFRVTQN